MQPAMMACWCCAWVLVLELGSAFLPDRRLGNTVCRFRRSISPSSWTTGAGVRTTSCSRLSVSSNSGRTLIDAEGLDEDYQDQTVSPTTSSPDLLACGMYRSIGDAVWQTLTDTSWMEPCAVPQDLLSNEAPTKGMKGWMTRIETRALKSKDPLRNPPHLNPISYARMALIETVPVLEYQVGEDESMRKRESDTPLVHTKGIQVLNVVIFPRRESSLPIWGADFVSLPSDKHLILLDAQPVDAGVRTGKLSAFDAYWLEWYQQHHVASRFPWGGDLPDSVTPFVSSSALWTRFIPSADTEENLREANPVDTILNDLQHIVESHLEIYLGLLSDGVVADADRDLQSDYIRYRRENDPARPMLKALYGEEWTESVLSNVLFPQNF